MIRKATMRRFPFGAWLALVAIATGPTTAAQDAEPAAAPPPENAADESPTHYAYSVLIDVPITVLSTSVAIGADLSDDEVSGPRVRSVDSVFVLDRFVARSPEQREAARTASDAVLFSSVVLGAVASAFSLADTGESRGDRREERVRRVGIFIESLAVTTAFTSVVKLGARRPRPFTYDPSYDPDAGSRDDELSFFSGHSSTVAAASATAIYFAFAESGRDPRRFVVLSAGMVATLSVATLRVRAARHFPSDVTVGAIVGASIGVLVPHLHRRTGLSLGAEPVAGGGLLTVSGRL